MKFNEDIQKSAAQQSIEQINLDSDTASQELRTLLPDCKTYLEQGLLFRAMARSKSYREKPEARKLLDNAVVSFRQHLNRLLQPDFEAHFLIVDCMVQKNDFPTAVEACAWIRDVLGNRLKELELDNPAFLMMDFESIQAELRQSQKNDEEMWAKNLGVIELTSVQKAEMRLKYGKIYAGRIRDLVAKLKTDYGDLLRRANLILGTLPQPSNAIEVEKTGQPAEMHSAETGEFSVESTSDTKPSIQQVSPASAVITYANGLAPVSAQRQKEIAAISKARTLSGATGEIDDKKQ